LITFAVLTLPVLKMIDGIMDKQCKPQSRGLLEEPYDLGFIPFVFNNMKIKTSMTIYIKLFLKFGIIQRKNQH